MTQIDDPGPPSAIDRALDLLSIAVSARRPLTLAELASEAGIPKPTAHRILRLLVARDLLRQTGDRSYCLGSKIFALSGEALAQLDYASEAKEGLRWLQTITPDAIHFAVMTGGAPVYVAKIEGRRPYRMASTIGTSLPTHCTSIGKAILAFMSPDQAEPYLQSPSLVGRTPHTITTPGALRQQFEEIRARGFAIDDEENEENVRCVGAPVFDARGDVIGGVSVSSATFDLSLEEALDLGPSVVTAAHRISATLGAPREALARLAALAAPGGGTTSGLVQSDGLARAEKA
jgi:IclR family acetate operon transcriptional repressor